MKKKLFYYLSPKHLQSELTGYGYEYSLKKILLQYAAIIFGSVLMGYAFYLDLPYILVMAFIGVLFLPSVLVSTYKNAYEQKRFWDICDYMELILTSFKLRRRFLPALKDVKKQFESSTPMGALIDQVVSFMENARMTEDKEIKAYEMIEAEYPTLKLKAVHRYIYSAEEQGGDFDNAIGILESDLSEWEKRQTSLQMERVRRKKLIYMAIVVCVIIETTILFALKLKGLDISKNVIVQIGTIVMWFLDLLIIKKADDRVSVDWLETNQLDPPEEIIRRYNLVKNFDEAKELKKSCMLALIPGVITIILFAAGVSKAICFITLLLTIFFAFSYKIGYRLAYKKTVKEIKRQFPRWLLDMSLRLQMESVQVALFESYDTAPEVLKPELKILFDKLKEDPTSEKPYLEFMKDFDIRGISSFMRMIYSVYDGSSKNTSEAIMDIIKKNNTYLEEAEKENNEDAMAPLVGMFYLPAVVEAGKLLCDMAVLFVGVLNSLSSISN